MGGGASRRPRDSGSEPLGNTEEEELTSAKILTPRISEEPSINTRLSGSKTTVTCDSMEVNASTDHISDALNRARREEAIHRGMVLDIPLVPTPPESPAPSGRKRRGSSAAHPLSIGPASPQPDFVIDDDSGSASFDELPVGTLALINKAVERGDLNDFLNLQRQRTVSTIKNAQLEKEVAELELQLRQMDMLESQGPALSRGVSSSKPVERLPAVEIKGMPRMHDVQSRERPNSGAAVLPDPNTDTSYTLRVPSQHGERGGGGSGQSSRGTRDDSHTPSGSSRNGSRGKGIVKSAMRNATSTSVLETVSFEGNSQTTAQKLTKRSEAPMPLDAMSPPPSPPPMDQDIAESDELRPNQGVLSEFSSTVGVNKYAAASGKSRDGENSESKPLTRDDSGLEKPVMRFEQPPHNSHHRPHRHIGKHKKNNSDTSIKKDRSESTSLFADQGLLSAEKEKPFSKVEAEPVVIINRKRNHKENSAHSGAVPVLTVAAAKGGTAAVSRRSIRSFDGEEEKYPLPVADSKRLLEPVGTTPSHPKKVDSTVIRPKPPSSLSPLHHNEDGNDEDSPGKHQQKDNEYSILSGHLPSSSQLLAPLSTVPVLRSDTEDSSRIPSLPTALLKEKPSGRTVLQNVNRRHTRNSSDEDAVIAQHQGAAATASAAAAYLQVISPRPGAAAVRDDGAQSTDQQVEESGAASVLSVSLSSRINQNNGTPATVPPGTNGSGGSSLDIAPPDNELISSKTSAIANAARRKRADRASLDHIGPELSDIKKAHRLEGGHSSDDNHYHSDAAPTTFSTDKGRNGERMRQNGGKRQKRRTFDDKLEGNCPSKMEKVTAAKDENTAETNCDTVDTGYLRPWSQTMELRLGEVEFMLRKPIGSDADIVSILQSAKDGLQFMDELNAVAKSLNMLRGSLSRWLLPYDDKTRIDEQSSNVETVVDNMPDDLIGKLTEKQVHYLVTAVNSVRQLVRVKIADDNDLEQARAALESTAVFFHRLTEEARLSNISPYELYVSKRG